MYDEQWALERAVEWAANSNCQSKRGVIIWHRQHGLVSGGYNAPPKPEKCDGTDACRAMCAKTAVHAEQAALINMIKYPAYPEIQTGELEMMHVKIVDGKAVTSEKPSCWQCSKLILAAGLKSMWLYEERGFVEYTPERFHIETLVNCKLF